MKIMAVDLGDARTGLAACDRTEFLASPLGVIHEGNPKQRLLKVAAAVKEFDIEQVVVGYPKNMNNTVGDRAHKSEEFVHQLSQLVSVPVVLWDERVTTVEAHHYLNTTNTRGKKRKEVVDAVAATILLESYLSYRKNQEASTDR